MYRIIGRKCGAAAISRTAWAGPFRRKAPSARRGKSSAHPHHVSRVAEGPLAGQLLTDLWASRAAELFGRQAPPKFPLLVKLLDCRELLSVQVHPNDAIARQLSAEGLLPEGELGKTEAWVVLSAQPQARIYAGLLPGTTREELEQRLDDGSVAQCLHEFAPRPAIAC